MRLEIRDAAIAAIAKCITARDPIAVPLELAEYVRKLAAVDRKIAGDDVALALNFSRRDVARPVAGWVGDVIFDRHAFVQRLGDMARDARGVDVIGMLEPLPPEPPEASDVAPTRRLRLVQL